MGNREYKMCEQFYQCMLLDLTTEKYLTNAILRSLEELNIDLNFLCRQEYDGLQQ